MTRHCLCTTVYSWYGVWVYVVFYGFFSLGSSTFGYNHNYIRSYVINRRLRSTTYNSIGARPGVLHVPPRWLITDIISYAHVYRCSTSSVQKQAGKIKMCLGYNFSRRRPMANGRRQSRRISFVVQKTDRRTHNGPNLR